MSNIEKQKQHWYRLALVARARKDDAAERMYTAEVWRLAKMEAGAA